MFRFTLHVKIRAGHQEEFENVWRDVAAVARMAPSNRGQALLRDVRDVAGYVICSDWETEEAFHDFERSPEQDELTAPIRALRESGTMSLYEVVATVGAAGPPHTGPAPARVGG